MKYLLSISIMLMTLGATSAHARELLLDASYMHPTGAIMTYAGGNDIIDPYFPTKALLTAHDSGMNIQAPARAWIRWMLRHQETNGLFSRFCRDEDMHDYRACLDADADDAMMAMWIELLYKMAPTAGLSDAWKQSARKAEAQLAALYDRDKGVYMVSKTIQTGLLIDNIEIYGAFKHAAKEAKRVGESQQAALFSLKAAQLKTGIIKSFWNPERKMFHASTQPRDKEVFYPDFVAQLMPMLYGFDFSVAVPSNQLYSAWMRDHHQEWTRLIGADFPWGLVAIVATQNNDITTAHCWLQQAAPHRQSGPWDVLDEAAFQSVEWQLHQKAPATTPACEGVVS